ncbi:unnamed protein product [Albugo candida]|uniref:Oxidoreductase FAD/NAD(P)-binding domain-containing protein n=1 Tax=Albugo candida TaxID=65357 RepID=A0A024FXP3_9STRA|nr:unnamed protein product [Albugo candida]|eukprot:CCI11424.1 unnamed protein product [Albugo candida]
MVTPKLGKYLESLNFGDTIEVSGTKGKSTYLGKGKLKIKRRVTDANAEIRSAKKIGMIAGGTGITPMMQILRRALTDPKAQTEFFSYLQSQLIVTPVRLGNTLSDLCPKI